MLALFLFDRNNQRTNIDTNRVIAQYLSCDYMNLTQLESLQIAFRHNVSKMYQY